MVIGWVMVVVGSLGGGGGEWLVDDGYLLIGGGERLVHVDWLVMLLIGL